MEADQALFPKALLGSVVQRASEADLDQMLLYLQRPDFIKQHPWVLLWYVFILGERRKTQAIPLIWDMLAREIDNLYMMDGCLESLGKLYHPRHADLRVRLVDKGLSDDVRIAAYGIYEGFDAIDAQDEVFLIDQIRQTVGQKKLPELVLAPLEILVIFRSRQALELVAELQPLLTSDVRSSVMELCEEIEDEQHLNYLRQQKPSLEHSLGSVKPRSLTQLKDLIREGHLRQADQGLLLVNDRNAVGAEAKKLRGNIALAEDRVEDAVALYREALLLYESTWELLPQGGLYDCIEELYSMLDQLKVEHDFPSMERAGVYLAGMLQFYGVLPWSVIESELARMMPLTTPFSFELFCAYLRECSEFVCAPDGAWITLASIEQPQKLLQDFDARHYVRRKLSLDECVLAGEFRVEHLWCDEVIHFHEFLEERSSGELSAFSFFPLLRNTEQKETFVTQALGLIGDDYEMDGFEDQQQLLKGFQDLWFFLPHPALGGYAPSDLGLSS